MKTNPIIIEPHLKEGDQEKHTDIAQASLFNAVVAIVNSERTAVWQRYSAMLIANSIVFGFIVRQEPGQAWFVITGCVLGLFLCSVWWILTEDSWRYFLLFSDIARRFCWPQVCEDVNPNKVMFDEFNRLASEGRFIFINRFNGGDRIKTLALGVILLFIICYSLFIIFSLYLLGYRLII